MCTYEDAACNHMQKSSKTQSVHAVCSIRAENSKAVQVDISRSLQWPISRRDGGQVDRVNDATNRKKPYFFLLSFVSLSAHV